MPSCWWNSDTISARRSRPLAASHHQAPSTSTPVGVKDRSRQSAPASVGGRRNVVSESRWPGFRLTRDCTAPGARCILTPTRRRGDRSGTRLYCKSPGCERGGAETAPGALPSSVRRMMDRRCRFPLSHVFARRNGSFGSLANDGRGCMLDARRGDTTRLAPAPSATVSATPRRSHSLCARPWRVACAHHDVIEPSCHGPGRPTEVGRAVT